MKLSQYDKCLEMIEAGASLDEIQAATGVSAAEILMMQDGARAAPYILLQMSGVYERCPECGAKVQLPCYSCFLKRHPKLDCIEVVSRPARNRHMPLHVTLDEQLYEGEDVEDFDDEDWEKEYEDNWGP